MKLRQFRFKPRRSEASDYVRHAFMCGEMKYLCESVEDFYRLYESPARIDLSLSYVLAFKKRIERLIEEREVRIAGKFKGYDVYRLDNFTVPRVEEGESDFSAFFCLSKEEDINAEDTGFYTDSDMEIGAVTAENQVVFMSVFKNVKGRTYLENYTGLPLTAATQSIVWKNPTVDSLKGVARDNFWKRLIKITGAVLTDSLQSELGENFWLNLGLEAIKSERYRVFFIDLSQNKPLITEGTHEDYFLNVFSLFYGKIRYVNEKQLIAIVDDNVLELDDEDDEL